MIFGSRGAAVFEACGAANAVAAPSNTTETRQVWILMVIPSALILSIPLPVEKLLPPAYNRLSCLSRPAARGIRNFCRLCCSAGWATGPLPEQRRPLMAYVIAEPCIGTKDTACVDVCPVDCIHPRKDEPAFEAETQLYIHPT